MEKQRDKAAQRLARKLNKQERGPEEEELHVLTEPLPLDGETEPVPE
jgi:hypothetical protein